MDSPIGESVPKTSVAAPSVLTAAPRPRETSGLRAFGRRFMRARLAWVGLLIIVAFALMAIFAPSLAPYDPNKQSLTQLLQPPNAQHWLGTDELGRDILSRILYGARVSLSVGIISVGIALVIGVVLGLISGYFGGWTDTLIGRGTDALLAFPALVLALAITSALGPSLTNAMLAIGVVGIPIYVRLTRGQVLALKEREFVEGARVAGASSPRIIFRHILPNVTSPIIVQASLGVAFAVLAEAGLSFLGLGVQPPTASWGSMINTGKNYLEMDPWVAIVPGIAIFLTVLGFNFLGDGIRDALDPHLKL